MLEFVFHLPADAAEDAAQSARVLAEVYVHTDSGDFPCKGWDDRVLSIMAAWLSGATGLLDPLRPLKRTTEVFETGPYQYTVTVSNDGMAIIHFLRSYIPAPVETVPSVEIPVREYGRRLLEAGRALRDTCQTVGFGGLPELEDLTRNIRRLESVLRADAQ